MLPILEYHGIDRPPAEAKQQFLYVRPGQFRRQLTLLRLLGYRGVSMSEGLRLMDEGRTKRIVVITFDDAYTDIFTNALPLLKAARFTATCFAVSERLGAYNTWDAAVLKARKPTMSADQLLAWRAAGMEVGGHTRTHAKLTECNDAELEAEIAGGKSDLEKLLGESITQFCYPYGRYDQRVRASVIRAGYQAAVTIQTGRARVSDDRFALPRVAVHGNRSLIVFPFRGLTRYADRKR